MCYTYSYRSLVTYIRCESANFINKYQNRHSSKSIKVMKLFFCQNDWLIGQWGLWLVPEGPWLLSCITYHLVNEFETRNYLLGLFRSRFRIRLFISYFLSNQFHWLGCNDIKFIYRRWQWLLKGQKICKAICGVLNSPKKRTKITILSEYPLFWKYTG